ncbi:DUF3572 family protein [Sphingomonas lacunae]|uniref:DUF3572 family protein n=1 Tax=Sphingomonas lacunae TaxID=2698828 RepID=A0A6M4AS82_9SPHN|nr:DUF3572 family protein [Sphingomonas lacunae]QJQ31917.1 DUF3572 family protein [Sphingomonas lacunae]
MLSDDRGKTSETDASVVLLGALAWVCAEDDRAHRFLALTGIDVGELRARATEPAILAAVGQFLADHEPDLIACADALSLAPATLAAAAGRLTG